MAFARPTVWPGLIYDEPQNYGITKVIILILCSSYFAVI